MGVTAILDSGGSVNGVDLSLGQCSIVSRNGIESIVGTVVSSQLKTEGVFFPKEVFKFKGQASSSVVTASGSMRNATSVGPFTGSLDHGVVVEGKRETLRDVGVG